MPNLHTDQYPPSYYFSSLKYPQEYPSLTDSISVDICIIGGGFTGIASAIELVERGYNVAILEAHKIGWGASGRNGGQVIKGIGHNLENFRSTIGQQGIDAISAMGTEANQIVFERIKKYDIDCDLTMGYCDLATRSKHMRLLEHDYKKLSSNNYPYSINLLDKNTLQKKIIGSTKFIGGLEDMGSGHLHPLNLCTGEAKVAQHLGVQVFTNTPVIEIIPGESVIVKTKNGQVNAKKIIIAGNAYIKNLTPKKLPNISNKILPAGSYIIATEKLKKELHQEILPNNHAVCDLKIDLDYFRLSADNRLLFGGMCNYSGRDPKDIKTVLYPKMVNVFPQLEGINIDFQWGGMIGIGANRLPQIGRLTNNIFYAQAYSGHGINVTHVAARLLAETIHGESDRIKHFEQVKHLTFLGGKYLRSPLLSLGMMYHKMIDRF